MYSVGEVSPEAKHIIAVAKRSWEIGIAEVRPGNHFGNIGYEIAKYAEEQKFPIIPCNLCGAQPNLKRSRIKRLINELEKETPFIRATMMTALTNVTGSHLLDNELYDFRNFAPMMKSIAPGHGSVEKELDEVFDHSESEFRIQNPAFTSIAAELIQ